MRRYANRCVMTRRLEAPVSEMTETEPRYLRVSEVAKIFDISTATVWRWVRAGKLPQPVKICGSTRWKRSTLLEACAALEEPFAA